MKPLGIQMNVEGKSWDDIEEAYGTRSAVVFGFGSQTPAELYTLYSSRFAGVEYYNTGFYANETVDYNFEQALLAQSVDEANEYWKKAQWDGKTGLSSARMLHPHGSLTLIICIL